ncbi:hypothetical protein GCM10007989_07450 [Devosia pacifica]|uniref:Uncharacterized protein n=1 Tax=Devosia pacifica TaxID=1335967 RepID=A0A918VQA6_9HYPH|nr:hypothetical protein [Devosia pacifica]GHA15203.1 hypothetical protein GCM10007989_07450 [Devosia pacifica]
MTDDEKRRAAEAILNVPFFNALFDEIETAAVNHCINAPMNDDETRRNAAAEARAIRKVRARLTSLAKQPGEPRKVPA